MTMPSPYPWFGGKGNVANIVWRAFGAVDNYVEPFFGSGAVLLGRPGSDFGIETVNDADGFVSNFWRALQADPDAVAYWADYPVNETDLHARHGWLVNRRERLTWSLEDPDFYDAKIAGWWVWGICSWIGSGWCSGEGPWQSDGAHIIDTRQLPHLGTAGRGINRKRPHLGYGVSDYLLSLADRMRKVRVCCGDWSRVMGDSVTVNHGLTAVFLDPPYSSEASRTDGLYSVDCLKVAHYVRDWCLENGANPLLRIVLCGYDGEHDMPPEWRCEAWKARGGYGSQGNCRGRENAGRERMWFSPHCVIAQERLFS